MEFRSHLEEAATAETAALHDQLSELACQNDALHGCSAVTAASVTSTATTVTTALVSNLSAMLDNLRKYNELTQGLSRATLPSAPHATIPVYSPDFEASPAKRLHVDTNEFHLDGHKKVTEPFTGADFTGLIMQNSIPPDIRNSITKDKFFEIYKLYKCDKVISTVLSAPSLGAPGVTITATTTSGASGKDPTTKSEIFYLLYQFGMFYLQLYPAKIAGFLEYLGFLTKEAKDFNVASLLRLDNAIRSQYINHPDWNWDQSHTEISRVFNQLSRRAENLLPGAVVHVVKGSAATPSKQPRGGRFQRHPRTGFRLSFPPPTWGPFPPQQSQAPGHVERCNNYNFSPKGCRNAKCQRLHMCAYCGDPTHLAPFCNSGSNPPLPTYPPPHYS